MKATPQQEETLRQRFVEAFQLAAGGNADLFGRMLGHTNGGYVRQVVSGKQPVRQALIERVHGMGGQFAGWFAGMIPWAEVPSGAPDMRRFSLAGLELAQAFDSVPDGPGKMRLYAVLQDEIRRAQLPPEARPRPVPALPPRRSPIQTP